MNTMSKFGSAWSPKPAPRRASYQWLGKRLRQLLNVYEEEPVPDRFRELLDQLAKSEAKTGNGPSSQQPQAAEKHEQ